MGERGREGEAYVPSSLDMSPSPSTQAFISVRDKRRCAALRACCASACDCSLDIGAACREVDAAGGAGLEGGGEGARG